MKSIFITVILNEEIAIEKFLDSLHEQTKKPDDITNGSCSKKLLVNLTEKSII